MTVNHPGRPRDHRLDTAILEAAKAVFLERGYQGASLSEIARRAGLGTPAIYRRWPTKAALAIDVFETFATPEPLPDTGSIRADLVAFMKQRLRLFRSLAMDRLMLPVAAEAKSDEALAASVRSRFLGYRERLHARIERAKRAGELRTGVNARWLVDTLMGSIIMAVVFSTEAPSDRDADAIVDQVLLGAKPRPRR